MCDEFEMSEDVEEVTINEQTTPSVLTVSLEELVVKHRERRLSSSSTSSGR